MNDESCVEDGVRQPMMTEERCEWLQVKFQPALLYCIEKLLFLTLCDQLGYQLFRTVESIVGVMPMIDAAVLWNCVRWSLKLSTVSGSCNKARRLSSLAVGIDFELLYLKETEKIRLDLASLFIRLPGYLAASLHKIRLIMLSQYHPARSAQGGLSI